MLKQVVTISSLGLLCLSSISTFAAKPVDLSKEHLDYLKAFASSNSVVAARGPSLKEVSQSTDFNQTQHIRVKQMYAGFPVMGADAVIHTPKAGNKKLFALINSAATNQSTMNGKIYEGLQQDLGTNPASIFTAAQADKALAQAIKYMEQSSDAPVKLDYKKIEPTIYVDKHNKAHWAFLLKTEVRIKGKMSQPIYILDATDFSIYKTWNNLQTSAADTVPAGGLGGNLRQKFIYDGSKENYPGFAVRRDANANLCFLENDDVIINDARTNKVAEFECEAPNTIHNGLFWANGNDEINGSFSPNNDAMFAAKIVGDMYQSWYQIPALIKNGKPMRMELFTHEPSVGENAFWHPIEEIMVFGDGGDTLYPTTSLGITAHEISHGFTSQHSDLAYEGQSGGMNEAFSDMAAQAAEYFLYGKSSWKIGSEVVKLESDLEAFRFVDQPSKDRMSLDSADDYFIGIDVHFSSGVYNRAFYLISNSEGWDVKKAFDVMVQANRFYWTSETNFDEGSCGVLKAVQDYKYDTKPVLTAFEQVGVDTSECS